MKAPDLTSTAIAGIFGAFFLILLGFFFLRDDENLSIPKLGAIGLAVGALTQVAIRLTGVS